MSTDRAELAEALALEREVRQRTAMVKRQSALRLRRLCPEMSCAQIGDRLSVDERTVYRWIAEAERRS